MKTAPLDTYAKPPIVEAVLEVKFDDRIDLHAVERFSRKFAGDYPVEEHVVRVDLNVPPGRPLEAGIKREEIGRKRFTADRTDVVTVSVDALSVSRLAPYCGWETYKGRFNEIWRKWTKLAGRRSVVRVGLRYINRIDIPENGGPLERYLATWPSLPPSLSPPVGFVQQVVFFEDDLQLIVSTATQPSPVPRYSALALDIDVSLNDNIAQNDAGLFSLLDRMRATKNRIFETCVTDTARELFR